MSGGSQVQGSIDLGSARLMASPDAESEGRLDSDSGVAGVCACGLTMIHGSESSGVRAGVGQGIIFCS
jgi:hypothetical protein